MTYELKLLSGVASTDDGRQELQYKCARQEAEDACNDNLLQWAVVLRHCRGGGGDIVHVHTYVHMRTQAKYVYVHIMSRGEVNSLKFLT